MLPLSGSQQVPQLLLSTLARLTPPSTSCCCEAKAGAWLCPADAGASPNGVLLTGLRASRCSRGCGVRPAAASVLLAGILLSCSSLDRQGLAVAQHEALSNSGAVSCTSALTLLAPFPKPPLWVCGCPITTRGSTRAPGFSHSLCSTHLAALADVAGTWVFLE